MAAKTETEWTPGPMRAVLTVNGWQVETLRPEPVVVAKMVGDQQEKPPVNGVAPMFAPAKANAYLFAAAPETTAALSDLLWAAERIPMATVNARGEPCCSYCSATGDTHGPLCVMPRLEAGISAARAALAKAEGR